MINAVRLYHVDVENRLETFPDLSYPSFHSAMRENPVEDVSKVVNARLTRDSATVWAMSQMEHRAETQTDSSHRTEGARRRV